MSTGMRVSARIEQRASAITNTMTVIGRRRAARRSHILMALLGSYRVRTVGREPDPRGMPRPEPSSARLRVAPQRRRFLLARADSRRLRHPPALPAPLGNALAPGSRLRGLLRVRPACSRRRGAPLQGKPALSVIVPSDLAGFVH